MCEQAERLRDSASELCKLLAARIETSRATHADLTGAAARPTRQSRRRTRRPSKT